MAEVHRLRRNGNIPGQKSGCVESWSHLVLGVSETQTAEDFVAEGLCCLYLMPVGKGLEYGARRDQGSDSMKVLPLCCPQTVVGCFAGRAWQVSGW